MPQAILSRLRHGASRGEMATFGIGYRGKIAHAAQSCSRVKNSESSGT